jgi:hypothetical protein
MIHTTPEGTKYYKSLEEAKADGHVLIPCSHVLCFFKLEGRKSVIEKANLEPIMNLQYLIHSKIENRYYLKTYAGYSVDEIFFYYRDKNAEVNEAIETLMNQVSAGVVTLLFTKEMVDDTKAMLQRVFKQNAKTDGAVAYVDFIPLLDEILKHNDYREYGRDLTGYKTVNSLFTQRIVEMWHQIRMKNLKTLIPK